MIPRPRIVTRKVPKGSSAAIRNTMEKMGRRGWTYIETRPFDKYHELLVFEMIR